MWDSRVQRFRELLIRYGRDSVAFQGLKEGMYLWFVPDGEGAVAYVDGGRHLVAVGSPIGPEQRRTELVAKFMRFASSQGKGAVFFGVEGRPDWQDPLMEPVQVGVQPVWDLEAWVRERPREVLRQIKRARRKGVRVVRISLEELASKRLRHTLEELVADWLVGQPMAPLSFLAKADPLDVPEDRLYFVAWCQGKLVAFLAAIPWPGERGWFLENLICPRSAPNGTAEMLVDTALRYMAVQGSKKATHGLAPLAELPEDPSILGRLFAYCYRNAGGLYNFQGLYRFKSKFRPHEWRPVYFVCRRDEKVSALVSILRAFAGGGLLGFAVRTGFKLGQRILRRLDRKILSRLSWAFASLLAGWLPVLGRLDSGKWFGATWLAKAWMTFDAALIVGFWWLGTLIAGGREQNGVELAKVLLGVMLADSWLSLVQWYLYNRPHATYGWELAFSFGFALAPFTALLFLGAVLLALPRRSGG